MITMATTAHSSTHLVLLVMEGNGKREEQSSVVEGGGQHLPATVQVEIRRLDLVRCKVVDHKAVRHLENTTHVLVARLGGGGGGGGREGGGGG